MKTIIEIRPKNDLLHFLLLATIPKNKATKAESYKYLCVEDNTGICCDGKRVHIVENINDLGCELESGVYSIEKNTKSLIQLSPVTTNEKYPNWRRVIPDYAGKDEFTWETYGQVDYSDAVCRLIRRLPEFTILNIDHLKDICNLRNDWKCCWYGVTELIKFVQGNVMAVTMPYSQ